MDLDYGFGETSPSHSAQAIAALPCAENLLDPPSDAMDGLVPLVALAQRFGFIAAPHAGCDNAGNTALRPHRTEKVIAAIGAVGINLTGIVGQRFKACIAIIDIGRCDRDCLDQRCIGVGTNVGVNRRRNGTPYRRAKGTPCKDRARLM